MLSAKLTHISNREKSIDILTRSPHIHIIADGKYCYRQHSNEELFMYDLCDIRQIMVGLRHFEQELKQATDLSLNEALCLCHTGKGLGEPGMMARELELSPSRLSRILESLEMKGLLERTISTEDRRSIMLQLSERGETIVEKLHCTEIPLPHHIEQAIETLHAHMQSGETK